MEISEGIQGQGYASVWKDNGPDFWRFATMKRQDQAQAQKVLENEKQVRDALVKENRQFAPDKVWEPFYGEVEDHAQTVRNFTSGMLNRNIPTGAFDNERNRMIGENRKLVNKINSYRTVHEDLSKRIDEDNNINKNYYERKLNDYFFNGRQAKPSDQINIDGIEDIFNDSTGYNMSAVSAAFMKDLPQQLTEKYRKIHSDLGEQFDVSTIKSKLGIVTDEKGAPKLDPRTGLPMVTLTDDVTMAALENPYIRNYVIDNLGADAIKPRADLEPVKNMLAPILTPYDQRSIQKEHKQGFKYTEGDKRGGAGYTVPESSVAERYDTLYRITHEHDPELLASLLPGLENVNIGYEVFGPGESKANPPRIVVSYPNKEFDKERPNEFPRFARKSLKLETEEDRQSAMEFLNTVMDDKLPAKQKIGENLTNYRKRVRKKEKDARGVYEGAERAVNSETGGVY